jgi:hypothetical protein
MSSRRRRKDQDLAPRGTASPGGSEDGYDEGPNGPARPDGWRDVVSTDYDYPPELDDLSRRDRRHAKKSWRKDDHAQRMAWLRDQRQAEPVSPVSVLVVVILLAVLILGIGGGLPKILGEGKSEQPVGLLTPQDPLPLPTAGGTSQPQATDRPTNSVVTTPPLETSRPSAAATASANDLVGEWAKRFYTRTPSTQSYDQLVDSVAPYLTAEMASSFTAQGDSTYEALRTDGGSSKVVSATVTAPKPGAAPTDTVGRISRVVTVVIDMTGKKPQQISLPLLVTVVQQENSWVVSDVDGGTGP